MHDVISCLDVQPDDHFNYYGFSHYARELNELTPQLEEVLPPTDVRFRPDQRFRNFFLVKNLFCFFFIDCMFSADKHFVQTLNFLLFPQASGGG